jgi:hypothetical protein
MSTVLTEFPWGRLVKAVFLVLLWFLWLMTEASFGLMTANIVAEGTRILFTPWGKKLHMMPGLGGLKQYEGWHQVDGALVFAVFTMIVMLVCWSFFFHRVLKAKKQWSQLLDCGELFSGIGERIAMISGAVLSLADAVLFYAAMNEMSWGTGWFSLTSLLATAAYCSLVVLCAFVSAQLSHKIKNL